MFDTLARHNNYQEDSTKIQDQGPKDQDSWCQDSRTPRFGMTWPRTKIHDAKIHQDTKIQDDMTKDQGPRFMMPRFQDTKIHQDTKIQDDRIPRTKIQDDMTKDQEARDQDL